MSEFLFYEQSNGVLSGEFAVIDSEVERFYGKCFSYTHTLVLSVSERKKSLETVGEICDFLLKNGANRYSKVTAIGGGVLLDMTGFAAAIYMRGIKWDAVPTTLLAQADSAIGGKTGVNFKAKNILGAFHCPENVIFIAEFLRSLNDDMLLSGLGEIVKTSLLDKKIYDFVKENKNELRCGEINILSRAAKLCALEKAKICDEDFYDTDKRNCLNIGHTVGHSIESCIGLSHGESVLWGLKIECELFGENIETSFRSEVSSVIEFFLKGRVLPQVIAEKIYEKILKDKKNNGGIVFVIPTQFGVTEKITLQPEAVKKSIYDYFTR